MLLCRAAAAVDQSHIPTSYTSSSHTPGPGPITRHPPSPLIIICVEISWRRDRRHTVISNTDADLSSETQRDSQTCYSGRWREHGASDSGHSQHLTDRVYCLPADNIPDTNINHLLSLLWAAKPCTSSCTHTTTSGRSHLTSTKHTKICGLYIETFKPIKL